MPLLHHPLPSLVRLDVEFMNPRSLQKSLESFPNFSPNIRKLFISVYDRDQFIKIEPNYLCHWRNLCVVSCIQVALDRKAFMHLSRMPALTWPECALSATVTFPVSDSPLSLSTLRKIVLSSNFLDPISRLLSQTRLPAIKEFSAFIDDRPSRQELSSFLASVQTSDAGNTVQELLLYQSCDFLGNSLRSETPLLGSKDLQPCLQFSNLRRLCLNIEWNVGLTDDGVLELVSKCPRLEDLRINEHWGWNSRGGITPGGLVQLLQTRQSLRRLALLIDTRGYTEIRESLASLGLTSPTFSTLNVLSSIIEAELVPAIATLLSDIAACTTNYLFFSAWEYLVVDHPNTRNFGVMSKVESMNHSVGPHHCSDLRLRQRNRITCLRAEQG